MNYIERTLKLTIMGLASLMMFMAVKCLCGSASMRSLKHNMQAFHLDMEYTGPGSEADRLDKATRDKENEKAFEKCHGENSDKATSRDWERARQYERDHAA